MTFIQAGAFSALLLVAVAVVAPLRGSELPGINGSPDPYALYGGCTEEGEFRAKQEHVYEVGRDLRSVLAIVVLECSGFTGGGQSSIVACPMGSPYAFCIFNDNDGASNLVRLGVLRRNAVTAPNTDYRGCPAGASLRSKASVVAEAGAELRLVKAIVTLRCRTADGPPGARVVKCPTGPHPYAYCVQSRNDGSGNAVLLGVVETNGAGDPFGLYGQCDPNAQLGFRSKVDLLREVGMSEANVRSIDLVQCVGPGTSPNIPDSLVRVACSSILQLQHPANYDTCIWGVDRKGNYLIVGVVTAPATGT